VSCLLIPCTNTASNLTVPLYDGSKTDTAYIGDYVQTSTNMKEAWKPSPAVMRSSGLIAGKFIFCEVYTF
jgi:hypothetical protein